MFLFLSLSFNLKFELSLFLLCWMTVRLSVWICVQSSGYLTVCLFAGVDRGEAVRLFVRLSVSLFCRMADLLFARCNV
jgi:hypothetical protein